MSLKTHKPIRNGAKKWLKTNKLHVKEGENTEKYLKINEIVS
jgi:hypothetical protein